jgi:hypothetical protein
MCFPALQWRSPDTRKCLQHNRFCESYPLSLMQRPSFGSLVRHHVDHGARGVVDYVVIVQMPELHDITDG